jgi:hypothetical protein
MRGDIAGKKARACRNLYMSCLGAGIGFFFVVVFLAAPVYLGIAAKMYDKHDS